MAEELQSHLKKVPEPNKRALVLGLGGGALCSYLHKKIPGLTVEGVEIDPTMLELAKKYFGFNPSETLKAHVADGLSFVRDLAGSSNFVFTRFTCAYIMLFLIKIPSTIA